MTEQYGFKFVVDANDAARGWKQFESAVEGVFGALDRMESHVEKSMGALKKNMDRGRKDLAAFNKAVGEVGRGNASGIKNIATLNSAMKGFKAPSAAQIKNVSAFFKALERAGTGGGGSAARNIAAISAAMGGFKAPSATNVRNLRDFFLALAAFPRNNGLTNAAGMFATLRQLQGFKAPSATQVKNLQAFLNTVANLRIPQNGAQVARALEQIARSATAANTHLRGLRGSIGSFNFNRFNSGARSAAVNMMGLQNAFSATYQMGSILRSLLGSLTIAELGRGFFEATNRVVAFQASMTVVSKEAGYAGKELQFLTDTALRLGLDYGKATESYGKFAISVNKAGGSAADARNIFEGFGNAMSVMGLAADKQGDVMLALQQSMNKGYVAGEELNQQLNEHLPGALGYLRAELAKSGVTLEHALKNKMLDATKTLNFLANQYRNDFGPALAEALDRPAAQMNIFRTNVTKLYEAIAANGGNEAFTDFLKQINSYFKPDDIERYAKAIGESLKTAVDKLSAAFAWLYENWDSIKGPLATTLDLIGRWAIISGTLQIGKFIVSPLLQIGAALGPLKQGSLYLRAITSINFASFIAATRGMNASTLAATRQLLALRVTVLGIPAAMRAAAGGVGVMTIALNGLSATGGLAVAGMRGFVNLLGGPFMVGLLAAGYAVYDLSSQLDKQGQIYKSSQELLEEVTTTIGDHNQAVLQAQIANYGLQKAMEMGSGAMKVMNNDAINLTTGLFGVANAARQAYVETLRLARGKLIEQRSGLMAQSPNAVVDLAGSEFKKGNTARGIAFNAYALYQKGLQTIGATEYSESDIGKQIGNINSSIGTVDQEMRNANSMEGFKQFFDIERAKRDGMGGASGPVDLLRSGSTDDKDKKRRGRKPPKGPDPVKEAERLRRKVDDIMGRLAEDNPLLKLQQDFTTDLTRQAETLLSDGGFKEWFDGIAKNGGDATAALGDLQDALNGAGVDQKVLTDLQTRYGVSIDQITESMDRQLYVYRQKVKEAKIDEQFGGRMMKNSLQELQMGRLNSSQQEILGAVLDEVNRYRAENNDLTQEQVDILTEQLTKQQKHLDLLAAEREFYENNGLKKFHDDIRTAGELVHDLDSNFLGSLKDQLTSLGTTGKFSLQSIFDTIQSGLVEWSASGITDAIGGLLSDGDSKNPTIFGGLLKSMGFNTGFDKTVAEQRIDAANVILYATRVDTQGNLFGEGWGAGGMLGAGGSEDIVVNGIKNWGLEEELARPLLSATDQVGRVMTQDWTQQIRGLGGLFQSFLGGMGGGGGGGGVLGSLLGVGMSIFGGGGGIPSGVQGASLDLIGSMPGIFKEGGISNNPVTRWRSAPHFSEGTANTSPGMPAYLHDNEAVIPLSRGRKVPVQLTPGSNSGSGTNVMNVWNITSPDADSFKRSQQQMTGQMHRAASRAYSRNN